ncbi:hypothetical protein HYN59_12735 [Flavobacterium album]|uniref:Uncharacterized protein n=1 Tax=Flavobacterium album TaxID=2175091 RepID=A0A2S1QZQ8_9FLAO|nr:hypothetical protein [Flavobacterium album]AWH85917.1 hypothetical protein HYN59_12735 [Flavobacterium album]
MRKLSVILLIASLVSCGKPKESLVLSVKNEAITYVDSSAIVNSYSYKNDTIRNKATNIITYTISNPTDKKYVLILNREYMYPHLSNKAVRPGSIGYFIKDANDSIVNCIPGIIDTFEAPVLDCGDCIIQERIKNYNKLSISEKYSLQADEYLRNSVTIFPGEIRTFKALTMLPVVLERSENGGGILRYKELKDDYTFELVYNCRAEVFKNSLPQYIIEELKNNNVEIFDGTLVSNKVSLRKVQ